MFLIYVNKRFHSFIHSFITDGAINSLINKFVYSLVDDCQLHMAYFSRKMVSLSENTI